MTEFDELRKIFSVLNKFKTSKDFDYEKYFKGASPEEVFESYKELVNDYATDFLSSYKKVRSITVNKTSGKEESIQKIIQRYLPDTESMEGAAFFYTCQMQKQPCVQIRTISNYVEPRDKNKWNIPLAIKNLGVSLSFFINELTK